ncbi:MAG TPA: rod shape-determining protein, partial [Acidimicrobiales bacterium]|nr:rod shape-determining protein [Acidimicrobiales bacterium]
AEEIKIAVGSAYAVNEGIRAEVRGRDVSSGLPKTVILTPAEIRLAIDEPVTAMMDSVVKCLGQAPPELSHDLIGQGISLVGGGSLLAGFAQRLAEETDLPVNLVGAPLESVVLGAGKCLESFDTLKVMFMRADR